MVLNNTSKIIKVKGPEHSREKNVLSGKFILHKGAKHIQALIYKPPIYLNEKLKELQVKILDLHKFQHGKPAKKEPIKVTNQWFERSFRTFYYKHNYSENIIFNILLNGMYCIRVNLYSPFIKN